MRLIRILIALACLATGVVVGALNPQAVDIDFGAFHVPTTLGVAVLISLLAGVIVGGVALVVGVVLPLRQRLRRAEARHRASTPSTGT